MQFQQGPLNNVYLKGSPSLFLTSIVFALLHISLHRQHHDRMRINLRAVRNVKRRKKNLRIWHWTIARINIAPWHGFNTELRNIRICQSVCHHFGSSCPSTRASSALLPSSSWCIPLYDAQIHNTCTQGNLKWL